MEGSSNLWKLPSLLFQTESQCSFDVWPSHTLNYMFILNSLLFSFLNISNTFAFPLKVGVIIQGMFPHLIFKRQGETTYYCRLECSMSNECSGNVTDQNLLHVISINTVYNHSAN